MPDRDKVIDYLQSEIYRAEQSVDDIWLECVEVKLLRDALALLKEQQEGVEPRVSSAEQRCGNCNKIIEMDGWKACPWCGKQINWESWW